MPLLDDKQTSELLRQFQGLENDVNIMLFTQQMECEYCHVTGELLKELSQLSPRVKLRVLDLVNDKAEAERYRVDKIPAIIINGGDGLDHGIRFYGVPAGYEFTTLVEDILMVSRGNHGLPNDVMRELDKVDQPVRLQVIISPTCPYCPTMVRTAHRFAMASKFITAEMVEISEFPWLAQRYEVQGVPHTMVGEGYGIVGVYKDLDFAKEILRGIGKLPIELTDHARIHGDEIAVPNSGPHSPEHDKQHQHQHEYQPAPGVTPIGDKPEHKPPKKASSRSSSTGAKAKKPAAKKSGKKGGKK